MVTAGSTDAVSLFLDAAGIEPDPTSTVALNAAAVSRHDNNAHPPVASRRSVSGILNQMVQLSGAHLDASFGALSDADRKSVV